MGIPVEKKTKGQLNDLTHNKPHQVREESQPLCTVGCPFKSFRLLKGVVLQASPIIAKRIDGLGALQKGYTEHPCCPKARL